MIGEIARGCDGNTLEGGFCGEGFVFGIFFQRRFTIPLLWRASGDDGEVGFYDFTLLECLLGNSGGFFVECEEQDSGCWSVEAMDWENSLTELIAEAFHGDPFRILWVAAGMHDHSSGLVDGDKGLVLK